jgi:hypothetical protein
VICETHEVKKDIFTKERFRKKNRIKEKKKRNDIKNMGMP